MAVLSLIVLTYAAFGFLGVVCLLLQFWESRVRKFTNVGNNPNFLQFQQKYFAAYYLALAGDWLQGPYLYKLYSHYGFEQPQIVILYVCGFASTVLLGTWAPVAADKFGRKKLCLFFTVIYSVACFLQQYRSYGVLIIARVLGGMATSLLFSAYEAWYISEHIETHDFPKEWIPVTFSKASLWSGILSVLAGLVSCLSVEWLDLGPVSPFMIAIPCLLISGVIVLTQWTENYSKQKVRFCKSCMEGFKEIVSEPKIFLLGAMQSLYESVIFVIIFLWTPLLDPAKPSLGLIFASFMVCTMIGTSVFRILISMRSNVLTLLTASITTGLLSVALCVLGAHPDRINRNMALIGFLLFEISVGVYFPAMGFLRSKIIPENKRISISNWFRIPLNTIASIILIFLHNESFRHGNRLIFVICLALMAVALLFAMRFNMIAGDSEELRVDNGEEQDFVVVQAEDVGNVSQA